MSTRSRWGFVVAAVAMFGGMLGVMVVLTPDFDQVTVGSEAPHFSAARVPSGESVPFERYHGDVVLLNIWATWCGPCEAEMPSMEALHRDLGPRGLRVVAVSVDDSEPSGVAQWVRDRELTFDVLHNPEGDIQRIYQTTGVPESFVIDRHGVIVKKVWGATDWTAAAHRALIERLLAQQPSG